MVPWRRKPRLDPPPDTPELRAFLDAIRREPFDDAPKLQLADWLDEHAGAFGRSRAELIRLQSAHAALRPLEECLQRDHGGMMTPELSDFYRRLRAWHKRYGSHPTYRNPFTEIGGRAFRADLWSLDFGGWSEWVRSDHGEEVTRFQSWLDEIPFRWTYQLVGDEVTDDLLSTLASLPLMKDVRRICLRCAFLGGGLAALYQSPYLEGKVELLLSSYFDGGTGFEMNPPESEEIVNYLKSRYGDRILISTWRPE